MTRCTVRFSCRCAALLALAAIARPAGAQETQLDLHASLAVGTSSHSRSWAAGAAAQVTFGSSSAPVKVSVSPASDAITLKAEERFGYVEGQEHTLTTRIGVLLKP